MKSDLTAKLAARLAARGIQLSNNNKTEKPSNKTKIKKEASHQSKIKQEPGLVKREADIETTPNSDVQTFTIRAAPQNAQKQAEMILSKNQELKYDEFGSKLPDGWERHFSKEHDTWYYWDLLTDRVAWLPPSHEYHEPQLVRDVNDLKSLNKNLTGVSIPNNLVKSNHKPDVAAPGEEKEKKNKTTKTEASEKKDSEKVYSSNPEINEIVKKKYENLNKMAENSGFSLEEIQEKISKSGSTNSTNPLKREATGHPSFQDQGYGSKDSSKLVKIEEMTLPHQQFANQSNSNSKRKMVSAAKMAKMEGKAFKRGAENGRTKGYMSREQVRETLNSKEEIDPMDPSSYSDAPNTRRWATGLTESKSGGTGLNGRASAHYMGM